MLEKFSLYKTDKLFNIISEQTDFVNFTAVFKMNDVSKLSLTLDYNQALDVVYDTGFILKYGESTIGSFFVRGFNHDFNAEHDYLTVECVDGIDILGRYLALPAPNGILSPTTYKYTTDGSTLASAFDIRTGSQEKIIKEYVRYNLEEGYCDAVREYDGFVVATLHNDPDGEGGIKTGYARFDNLLEFIRDLSAPSSDVKTEMRFFMDGLTFDVVPTVDKTASVNFNIDSQSVKAYNYSITPATANYLYVGGSGVDENRIFIEFMDTYSPEVILRYGRIEKFLDKSSSAQDNLNDEITELYAQGLNELFNSLDKTNLKFVPFDTTEISIIDDYWLGDKVTAIVDGVTIQDVVREIEVSVSRDDITITPTIGAPEARRDVLLNLYNNNRKMVKRIGKFERV